MSGRSGWSTRRSGSRRRAVRVIPRIARQLGIDEESLRSWVRQAEVDTGARPGVSTEEHRRNLELERENRELRRANEILKAAASFFASARPATAQVVTFIEAHRHRWGVEPICRVLQFAPSTYYAARRRPPSARSLRDDELKTEIARVHEANFSVYGADKCWRQLRREGIEVGRDRVARLMRELGLEGARRGKATRTTKAGPRRTVRRTMWTGCSPPPHPIGCGWRI